MKTLKLNSLQSNSIKEREMKHIVGGECVWTDKCCCACAYANQGGASTNDNKSANDKRGLCSPQCPDPD